MENSSRGNTLRLSVARALLIGSVAGACGLTSVAASAQELEEITVTARKRAENIQDVPVAVSAIAGADIENAFTLDTTALAGFAPNVVFDTIEMGTPAGGGFSIRGISYQDVDKAFDPVVLVAVDDVPLATGTGQVFDLIDIERIEVLRGPQGTLFGKNVVGGLINVHRTKPKLNETSGKIRARAGMYKKYSGDLLLNYGSDQWAVKLTGGIERQDKGFFKAPNTPGGRAWERQAERFGIHMLWEPNDVFTGELQFNYDRLHGQQAPTFLLDVNTKDTFCLLSTLFGNPQCAGVLGDVVGNDRHVNMANRKQPMELEKYQGILTLNAKITDADTLTYIGSYLYAKDSVYIDGDGSPFDFYTFTRYGDYDQFSHELRLTHDSGGAFTWQTGVFGATAEGTLHQLTDLTDLIGIPGYTTREFSRTTSESYAVFGEGDYRMLDNKLVLTGGLRYLTETKKLVRDVQSLITGNYDVGPHAGGERTDKKLIYRWGARYHFNDDVMAYFTNSTGFRSGGFSPRAQDPVILAKGFGPEKLTNWEVGLRTELLDNRLIVNLTGFHMIYDNMQIELAIPSAGGTGTQLSIENIGKAKLSGVELDMQAAVTDWWRVSGNAGYLHAKYKELVADLYSDGIVADETHLKLRRAPKWTYSITSDMSFPVGDGKVSWRASYNWRDTYEATATNYAGSAVKSFGILDSSISYELGNWKASIYGRNLTNEDAYTHVYIVNGLRPTPTDASPGTFWRFAQVRAPRELGLELVYSF